MVLFDIRLLLPNIQNQVGKTASQKYTKQTLIFKEISGKKVEIDLNGGKVSGDTGLLFVRHTESQIGIIKRIAKALHYKRHSSYVKYQIVELLIQRVF